MFHSRTLPASWELKTWTWSPPWLLLRMPRPSLWSRPSSSTSSPTSKWLTSCNDQIPASSLLSPLTYLWPSRSCFWSTCLKRFRCHASASCPRPLPSPYSLTARLAWWWTAAPPQLVSGLSLTGMLTLLGRAQSLSVVGMCPSSWSKPWHGKSTRRRPAPPYPASTPAVWNRSADFHCILVEKKQETVRCCRRRCTSGRIGAVDEASTTTQEKELRSSQRWTSPTSFTWLQRWCTPPSTWPAWWWRPPRTFPPTCSRTASQTYWFRAATLTYKVSPQDFLVTWERRFQNK